MSDLSGFRIYDTTGFTGKPDVSVYGIASAWILYEGGALPNGTDADLINLFFETAVAHPNVPWILDVESLPIESGMVLQSANIQRLTHILQLAQSQSRGQSVSYFGGAITYRQVNDDDSDLLALANQQDFFCPDCYTRVGQDQSTWGAKTLSLISRANGMDSTKPVYPFLWMQIFDPCAVGVNPCPTNGAVAVPSDLWAHELQVSEKDADGIVIWGGYNLTTLHPLSNPIHWDDNAPWWQVTKDFIASNQRPPSPPTLAGSQGNPVLKINMFMLQ